MSLCMPFVVGPVSELSTTVRVLGQLPGALVSVLGLPGLTKIAVETAISGDQYLKLVPGVQLSRHQVLVVIQEFAGESSDLPSVELGMIVQPQPQTKDDLSVVGLNTHLYACGRFVWATGVVPGATVAVFANGFSIGSGQALEGFARFTLTVGIPIGSIVTAHQFATLPSSIVVVGDDFVSSADLPPVPLHSGLPLPAPVVNLPLRKCDQAILISGVVDGALVTIHRSSGLPDESAGFDVNSSWFVLQNALKEGETLTVKQELHERCELVGEWSRPVLVGPLGTVEPPIISQPLCKGMQRITLHNLRPGAAISILANGDVYRGSAPLDGTIGTFGIPPLSSDTVVATQQVCGVGSAPSIPAPVEDHQEHIPAVTLMGPLFKCAANVSVRNIHPGAVVQVFAKNAQGLAPISGQVSIYEVQAVIPVYPYLRADDEVFIAQWACGHARTDSNSERVKVHGPVQPPHVLDALRAGDTEVLLWNVVPGALVEIYVQKTPQDARHFIGSEVGNALFASVVVPSAILLQAGDLVSARQWLCDASDIRRPVRVGDLPGFGPRPFYAVAHNPNTIQDVKNALADGANAMEPDVNVYLDDNSQLCISHDEAKSGTISLQQYLTELHAIAVADQRLALVVFDCKGPVARADHGLTLLTAIRNFLTFDTGLNIIISVGELGGKAIFQNIGHLLGPREGLMIDEENDPIAVSNFFYNAGVHNQTYGNGTTNGAHLQSSLERASAFRAALGRLKFIYAWTINKKAQKQELIRIGVDGIISDNIPDLIDRVQEPQFQKVIRLANRVDNPLQPANFTYSLAVHTANRSGAGTDANVTFTLTGTNGSSQKTVNTQLDLRMETDNQNFVTLPSPDLGTLLSVTVQRDNQGIGPNWFLDKIEVQSFRYKVLKTATFNQEINGTLPVTVPLV